jgi:rare lipoprotein A (peptidoglycan hydrolase)
MSAHLHHPRSLLALLATAACITGGAATSDRAFAASDSAGTGSTGGSIASAQSGAAAGGTATGGSLSGGTATKPSSASHASGSQASKAARSATVHSAIATWYGPGFFGHETACGQTLTPAVVGVANRTLPCGTLVKFSYDGHSKIVPVLDRGPYAHNGASWDLTAGAAAALDITETVRISALVVGSVPNSPTLGSPPREAGSPPREAGSPPREAGSPSGEAASAPVEATFGASQAG